jgi:hypothetical protein
MRPGRRRPPRPACLLARPATSRIRPRASPPPPAPLPLLTRQPRAPMALNVDIDELRARLEGMWQHTPPSISAGGTDETQPFRVAARSPCLPSPPPPPRRATRAPTARGAPGVQCQGTGMCRAVAAPWLSGRRRAGPYARATRAPAVARRIPRRARARTAGAAAPRGPRRRASGRGALRGAAPAGGGGGGSPAASRGPPPAPRPRPPPGGAGAAPPRPSRGPSPGPWPPCRRCSRVSLADARAPWPAGGAPRATRPAGGRPPRGPTRPARPRAPPSRS